MLEAIFSDPVKAGIVWRDVEALFQACGADVSEGQGSRVRVALNGVRAVFHRPHPQKETDKGAVKSVRRFLSEAGIRP
ncbi:type II toxin-antitoxin system HicA family toxin [Agrobacterium rubi]|uniref:type II toxin-antitoxin system HicA family toxin n=1 Tax=Agrobacterium rubi TaxID=28099 RepID=UPI002E2D9093|nr:type II toxin-antitoxin system HicA family toxin [Agrobacterium rubi]